MTFTVKRAVLRPEQLKDRMNNTMRVPDNAQLTTKILAASSKLESSINFRTILPMNS